jgi:hypothetical protein
MVSLLLDAWGDSLGLWWCSTVAVVVAVVVAAVAAAVVAVAGTHKGQMGPWLCALMVVLEQNVVVVALQRVVAVVGIGVVVVVEWRRQEDTAVVVADYYYSGCGLNTCGMDGMGVPPPTQQQGVVERMMGGQRWCYYQLCYKKVDHLLHHDEGIAPSAIGDQAVLGMVESVGNPSCAIMVHCKSLEASVEHLNS